MNEPHHLIPRLVAGALVAGALAVSSPAHANIGDVFPVEQTEVALSRTGQSLRVHEHDGLREFAGADGKVYAITWKTQRPPSVEALLGPYLAEYQAAFAKTRARSHSFVLVQTPNVVVVKTVHARFASGSIHVPAQMPKGVTIHDLP